MTATVIVDDIAALTVREVFANGRYVVPVYQRAFAWGENQILTLLQDVSDYNRRGAESYFIGSLVTHRGADAFGEQVAFEVVDGQQRLTTLFIILNTLASEQEVRPPAAVLSYEGRAGSTKDLIVLARDGRDCAVGDLTVAGIRIAVEAVRSAFRSGIFTQSDLEYLIDHVKVARTTLPARTDLNHYFEVMNSRGEQLEKHEIVKAHLMSLMASTPDADSRSHAFAVVWDACSDLTRHIQARFPAKVRDELFGRETSDEWLVRDFNDVISAVSTTGSGVSRSTTLSAILDARTVSQSDQVETDDDTVERYGAIIDFPNFLLHVLALSDPRRSRFAWADGDSSSRASLDDKRLVEEFESRIRTADQAEGFAFALLRARYLFDRYVIKTDLTRASVDDSNWVLNRVRVLSNSGQRKLSPIATFAPDESEDPSPVAESSQSHIVTLQSMFQVTDSRRAYKNFLYAILDYLYRQSGVTAEGFVAFLQGLARDRFVASSAGAQLDTGTSVPHFALNYLDYLLWRKSLDERPSRNDIAFRTFRFSYRTSIEHFYPQHPGPDSQIHELAQDVVDQFGNLCLMTRSENSQRSNLAPAAKVEQYVSDRQSLKFQVMAAITKGQSGWTPEQMRAHGDEMRVILEQATRSAPGVGL